LFFSIQSDDDGTAEDSELNDHGAPRIVVKVNKTTGGQGPQHTPRNIPLPETRFCGAPLNLYLNDLMDERRTTTENETVELHNVEEWVCCGRSASNFPI
jgi:hypothetical protein